MSSATSNPPRGGPEDRGGPRDPSVTARIGSWQRAARGYAAVRRLRLARFGDNMRNVAVTEVTRSRPSIGSESRSTPYGVNDLVAVVDSVTDAEVDALIAEYTDLYDFDAVLARGVTDTTPSATARGSRRDCARSSPTVGSARSPPTSRTSAVYASCPVSPYSG